MKQELSSEASLCKAVALDFLWLIYQAYSWSGRKLTIMRLEGFLQRLDGAIGPLVSFE